MVLEWGDKAVMEKAVWFQNESDPARNSNVYTVAEKLVLKHFPGGCLLYLPRKDSHTGKIATGFGPQSRGKTFLL